MSKPTPLHLDRYDMRTADIVLGAAHHAMQLGNVDAWERLHNLKLSQVGSVTIPADLVEFVQVVA